MTKQTGLGDALYVAGYDLSGDIGALGRVGGGPSPLEVTGIDKSAFERIGGVRDGAIEYSAWFNPSNGQAHDRLSTLPTSDVIVTYCRGTSLGSPAASLVAKQVNYDGSRSNDGAFSFSGSFDGDGYAIEWGRLLTAGSREDTAATNGSSVDLKVGSTTFGLQAYLHVFEFTGTDVTIKLQGSSDDGGSDAFADIVGGGFTQVTSGPTSQRIATASGATIERYIRVVTTTTGGFDSLSFAVAVVRNSTAVVF